MLSIINCIQNFHNHPLVLASGNTYFSNFGEDILISILLRDEQVKGIYVDVGAYDPIRFSNTFLLAVNGWRGINIDASREAIERFNAARPNDVNIHALIAESEKEMEFYKFKSDTYNTADAESLPRKLARNDPDLVPHTVEKVTAVTLNSILAKHAEGQKIDLLNIDAEGFDLRILYSLDFNLYRPKVICLEINVEDWTSEPLKSFIAQKRYKVVGHYCTSTILQRED